MEEQELIHRLRSGEEEAFEIIFRKYFQGMCLFAEHFVRNHETAEEIVEDFFCHLWDNCHHLMISSSLKGYLYRSIHNRCLNHIRNQKVRQQYITENPYVLSDDELTEPDAAEEPFSRLITGELEEKIVGAIDALPDQCRTIFCLNRFDNLTYAQIAEKLHISVNTVKTQMTRALHKLKNGLKDYLAIMLALVFMTR
jgi:RNA polymerase sigma-70 factor, ECF subfamily